MTVELKSLSELNELQDGANSKAFACGLDIDLSDKIKIENADALDLLKLLILFQTTRESSEELEEIRQLVRVCLSAIFHFLLTMLRVPLQIIPFS